jgi:hypothetical protein
MREVNVRVLLLFKTGSREEKNDGGDESRR